MKTILDKATRNELISRINMLAENSQPVWGQMTVAQMMRHCAMWDEMAQGKTKYKQSLLGKLFGKMALKDMLKEGPAKRNLPTVPSFKIAEEPNFAEEKKKWIELLEQYADYSTLGWIHPFFGMMNKEQTGYIVYKHVDHHLRQFGA